MDEDTATDIAELIALSHVFSAFFLDGPNEAFVERLIAHDAVSQWPSLGDGDCRRKALAQLSRALAAWQPADTAALQMEHAELFVGPGPQKAPPWGSFYSSDERLLMGPSTLALERFVKTRGVRYVLTENQPLDHIGLCFGILAQLFDQRRDELSGGVDTGAAMAIRTFLRDHFLPWAQQCVALHRTHGRSELQCSLAGLTELFLLNLERTFAAGQGLGDTTLAPVPPATTVNRQKPP